MIGDCYTEYDAYRRKAALKIGSLCEIAVIGQNCAHSALKERIKMKSDKAKVQNRNWNNLNNNYYYIFIPDIVFGRVLRTMQDHKELHFVYTVHSPVGFRN